MDLVCFDQNDLIAKKMQSKLNTKAEHFFVFNDVVKFLSHLRNEVCIGAEVFIVASEVDLKLAGMDIEYFMMAYDMSIPIFTYSKNEFSVQLKMNYISDYFSHHTESGVDFFLAERKSFQLFLMQEVYEMNAQCLFCENAVCKKREHTLKEAVSNDNLAVNVNDFSDICASLTKLQAKLFKYLALHKDGANIDEIERAIWHDSSKDKRQNVYTLICGLRNALSEFCGDKYKIIHVQNGYRLLNLGEL